MTRATRLAALIVVIVVVQVAVFPHLRLFGVVPDLGLHRRARGRVPGRTRKRARSSASRPASASISSSRRRSDSTRSRTRSSDTASACSKPACSARRAGCRRSSARVGGLAGGLLFIGHRRARRRRRGEGHAGRRRRSRSPRCTTRCSRRSCSSWSGGCSGATTACATRGRRADAPEHADRPGLPASVPTSVRRVSMSLLTA